MLNTGQTQAEKCKPPTKGQLEVIQLLIKGFTSEEAAQSLAISPVAARSRMFYLRDRLGVTTNEQAVFRLCQQNLL